MRRPALTLCIAVVAALAALAGAAGCGLGAGLGASGVRLIVTRDFGTKLVGKVSTAHTAGSETVMRYLTRHFRIATRYGGGFVESIDGYSGGTQGGRPIDWFFYVNGSEANKGAASTLLHAGDRVWWDRHDWGTVMDSPAVIGSFPEPFLHGLGGKRLPLVLECANDVQGACGMVDIRLSAAGITSRSRSAFGAPVGSDTLRIVVGTLADLKGDPAERQLAAGPSRSGVYVRLAGGRIFMLDQRGRAVKTLADGDGLIAATRLAGQRPTWFVTGASTAGVEAAANALRESALANRFALAVVNGRNVGVPEVRK